MHRSPPPSRAGSPGFPRRRGDAPSNSPSAPTSSAFPPQARGCTLVDLDPDERREVSPAGAGMHLPPATSCGHHTGFPRRRGDAPIVPLDWWWDGEFPPQARGCTAGPPETAAARPVSPAGAGMHPRPRASSRAAPRFPRRRGDAPRLFLTTVWKAQFPPQARGCTSRYRVKRRPPVVSPAGAGMHPIQRTPRTQDAGFPRRRGDAPHLLRFVLRESAFPPQARGCTHRLHRHPQHRGVSPAGAGMHRPRLRGGWAAIGFPRRRGDAPTPRSDSLIQHQFPPQARGCTPRRAAGVSADHVSPAGAGMHLCARLDNARNIRFPRRRGDAPVGVGPSESGYMFPPQARGCTPPRSQGIPAGGVSPAGAGMHLSITAEDIAAGGFPRRRGDAPDKSPVPPDAYAFPPQARGCTRQVARSARRVCVSPAGAGMHPGLQGTCSFRHRFPRRRGDAPQSTKDGRGRPEFPPQARGCTLARHSPMRRARVSPAGAGMHRSPSLPRSGRLGFPRRRGDGPPEPNDISIVAGRIPFPPEAVADASRGRTSGLRVLLVRMTGTPSRSRALRCGAHPSTDRRLIE